MKLYQLTTLGPVVLYKCTKTLCKQCGKPIAPDSAEGLCSVCRIKARTLKRQEEARQRAEQLKAERAAKAAEEAAKAAENAAGDHSGSRPDRGDCRSPDRGDRCRPAGDHPRRAERCPGKRDGTRARSAALRMMIKKGLIL